MKAKDRFYSDSAILIISLVLDLAMLYDDSVTVDSLELQEIPSG